MSYQTQGKGGGLSITFRSTAKNVSQKINEISIADNPVSVGVTSQNVYTVPAGKKAKINSLFARAVSFGTNTFMRFSILSSGPAARLVNETSPETILTEKLGQTSGIEIDATDRISLDGDGAGNNGSMGFRITIQETPL